MTAPVNDNVLFNITMLLRGGRGRRGDKASGKRQMVEGGKLKRSNETGRQESKHGRKKPEMATVVASWGRGSGRLVSYTRS